MPITMNHAFLDLTMASLHWGGCICKLGVCCITFRGAGETLVKMGQVMSLLHVETKLGLLVGNLLSGSSGQWW